MLLAAVDSDTFLGGGRTRESQCRMNKPGGTGSMLGWINSVKRWEGGGGSWGIFTARPTSWSLVRHRASGRDELEKKGPSFRPRKVHQVTWRNRDTIPLRPQAAARSVNRDFFFPSLIRLFSRAGESRAGMVSSPTQTPVCRGMPALRL